MSLKDIAFRPFDELDPDRKLAMWYCIAGCRDILQSARLRDVSLDAAFYAEVNGHLRLYLEKRQMPPADIAAPILNLAEDLSAGRKPTIRSGDYIAIRNFMRSKKSARTHDEE